MRFPPRDATGQRCPADHKSANPAQMGLSCLECAAIFSHLAVNGPDGARGHCKSDDDQTLSDDMRCRNSRCGGNLARTGPELSGPAGAELWRAGRISSGRPHAEFRRAGRRRRRDAAGVAAAARSGRRSALRPPRWRSPGLFGRPAAGAGERCRTETETHENATLRAGARPASRPT